MPPPRARWLLIVLPVVGLAVYWFARSPSAVPTDERPAEAATPVLAAGDARRAQPGHESPPPVADSESIRAGLVARRTEWLALPRDQAVARIVEALRSGDDRVTGLDFKVGDDGFLSGWPTSRTFLLDTLMAVDPAAAAAMGREVLRRPTTADEWALALRNVALGEEQVDRDFLQAKTEELICHPSWQADPSVGYLNAFDVLVHAEAIDSTPLLSELVQRKERRDLAHAGFLALDRLVQRQPAEMLARIGADGSLRASRPEMVAQQFARADVRVAGQRALLEQWLLDPARSGAELEAFAGVYPNQNRFVSKNLLTHEAAHSGADLAAHDREALRIVSAWAADSRFDPIRDCVLSMRGRLNAFVVSRGASAPPPSPRAPPLSD